MRKRAADAQKRLTEAKAARTTRLLAAYRGAAAAIDTIYKDLTRSHLHPTGGSASLSLDDEDQPFESDGGGIRFSVMPPGKQFRDMAALSGGEKTQAALALIFALHAARPSPFLVMDEIDAALDATNVHRVAAYVRARALGRLARLPRRMSSSSGAGAGGRSRSGSGSAAADDDEMDALTAGVQAIVISLKPAFFDKASSLVGVYQDAAAQGSGILTLDLEPYPPAAPAAASATAAAGGAGAGAGSVAGSAGSASRAPSAASSADRSVAAGGRR